MSAAVFWIIFCSVLIAVCCTIIKELRRFTPGSRKAARRIDHTHYLDNTVYECSACGTRFREKSMVCPHCGVHFTDTEEDDTDLWLEMDEIMEWDDEDDS